MFPSYDPIVVHYDTLFVRILLHTGQQQQQTSFRISFTRVEELWDEQLILFGFRPVIVVVQKYFWETEIIILNVMGDILVLLFFGDLLHHYHKFLVLYVAHNHVSFQLPFYLVEVCWETTVYLLLYQMIHCSFSPSQVGL